MVSDIKFLSASSSSSGYRSEIQYWNVTDHGEVRTRQSPPIKSIYSKKFQYLHDKTMYTRVKSDHLVIDFSLIYYTVQEKICSTDKRNFFKSDYDRIRNQLNRINWHHELIDKNLPQSWSQFAEVNINFLLNVFTALKGTIFIFYLLSL